MKFKDLFLPKIARSDPNVRIEAVKEEINRELLKQVVEQDDNSAVREAAKSRLQQLAA